MNVIHWKTIVVCILFIVSSLSHAEPMDDVIDMLGENSGTRVGYHSSEGYYIVSFAQSKKYTSKNSYEGAYKQSLNLLKSTLKNISAVKNEKTNPNAIQASDYSDNTEFSVQEFADLTSDYFSANANKVKELKSGEYDGANFVALVLSEDSIGGSTRLSSINEGHLFDSEMDIESIESKGTASIDLGKTPARKAALMDAFKNAIQQSKGLHFQSKTAKSSEIVTIAISSNIEGYISRYEMLDEDIEQGLYYVIIDAYIDSNKVQNDVSFYTSLFEKPIIGIDAPNDQARIWISDKLENLGFTLNDGQSDPTHLFVYKENQNKIENLKGKPGIETRLSLQLKDTKTGEILFTVTNTLKKTRVFVASESSAKRSSKTLAQREMKQRLAIEVIKALATQSEKSSHQG